VSDLSSQHPDLLARLLGPIGPELTCEECFEQLDRYVEKQMAAHDVEVFVAGIQAHLQGCAACSEDHRALLDLVRAQDARGH
jgi:hypothetical protein